MDSVVKEMKEKKHVYWFGIPGIQINSLVDCILLAVFTSLYFYKKKLKGLWISNRKWQYIPMCADRPKIADEETCVLRVHQNKCGYLKVFPLVKYCIC